MWQLEHDYMCSFCSALGTTGTQQGQINASGAEGRAGCSKGSSWAI